jgi:hypothetical protein
MYDETFFDTNEFDEIPEHGLPTESGQNICFFETVDGEITEFPHWIAKLYFAIIYTLGNYNGDCNSDDLRKIRVYIKKNKKNIRGGVIQYLNYFFKTEIPDPVNVKSEDMKGFDELLQKSGSAMIQLFEDNNISSKYRKKRGVKELSRFIKRGYSKVTKRINTKTSRKKRKEIGDKSMTQISDISAFTFSDRPAFLSLIREIFQVLDPESYARFKYFFCGNSFRPLEIEKGGTQNKVTKTTQRITVNFVPHPSRAPVCDSVPSIPPGIKEVFKEVFETCHSQNLGSSFEDLEEYYLNVLASQIFPSSDTAEIFEINLWKLKRELIIYFRRLK